MLAVAPGPMVFALVPMIAGKQAPMMHENVLSKQIRWIYGATKIVWKPTLPVVPLKESSL